FRIALSSIRAGSAGELTDTIDTSISGAGVIVVTLTVLKAFLAVTIAFVTLAATSASLDYIRARSLLLVTSVDGTFVSIITIFINDTLFAFTIGNIALLASPAANGISDTFPIFTAVINRAEVVVSADGSLD